MPVARLAIAGMDQIEIYGRKIEVKRMSALNLSFPLNEAIIVANSVVWTVVQARRGRKRARTLPLCSLATFLFTSMKRRCLRLCLLLRGLSPFTSIEDSRVGSPKVGGKQAQPEYLELLLMQIFNLYAYRLLSFVSDEAASAAVRILDGFQLGERHVVARRGGKHI